MKASIFVTGRRRLLMVLGSALLATVTMGWSKAADGTGATAKKGGGTQLATFGGGCFWCLEAQLEKFEGVKEVVSGYAGGTVPDPSYKQVCQGDTGHAEVVQVEFDPKKITYAQLLEIFFEIHDPTTLNQQGADKGTQYRSVILFHDDEQKRAAEQAKKAAQAQQKDPIVTEIVKLEKFYPAEGYHQDYFRKNPNAPYCVYVIQPKMQKLLKHGKIAH